MIIRVDKKTGGTEELSSRETAEKLLGFFRLPSQVMAKTEPWQVIETAYAYFMKIEEGLRDKRDKELPEESGKLIDENRTDLDDADFGVQVQALLKAWPGIRITIEGAAVEGVPDIGSIILSPPVHSGYKVGYSKGCDMPALSRAIDDMLRPT